MSLMMLMLQSCRRLLGASSMAQSSSLASCACVFREEHVCLAAGKVVDFDNQSGSSKGALLESRHTPTGQQKPEAAAKRSRVISQRLRHE